MTTLIVLACVTAYVVADLYAARAIYRHRRAKKIDKNAASRYGLRLNDPVGYFDDHDRDLVVFESVVMAIFWPVFLAGWGIGRFVTRNPSQSRTELQQRIAELEAELGIDQPRH